MEKFESGIRYKHLGSETLTTTSIYVGNISGAELLAELLKLPGTTVVKTDYAAYGKNAGNICESKEGVYRTG